MYSYDKHYQQTADTTRCYVGYLFWLMLLVGLVLLSGCASYERDYAAWEKSLAERDWTPPPPGYDGGVVIDIIVPADSIIYIPRGDGSFEYGYTSGN